MVQLKHYLLMSINDHYGLKAPMFHKIISNTKDLILPLELTRLLATVPPKDMLQVLNIGCGVEVEVEGINIGYRIPFWQHDKDNSLRGGGAEFISELGVRIHQTYPMLKELFQNAKEGAWKTSDRTSIHVHLNVGNLSFAQLNSLMILYMIFEKPLFNYACAERYNNIFCVPAEMCLTHLTGRGRGNIESFIESVEKYSAINFLAVREKGTIEFRHFHTEFDAIRVFKWILLLGLLKRAATHVPLAKIKEMVMTLKFTSDYERNMQGVFFGFSKLLEWNPKDLDQAVSDSKLFFFQ